MRLIGNRKPKRMGAINNPAYIKAAEVGSRPSASTPLAMPSTAMRTATPIAICHPYPDIAGSLVRVFDSIGNETQFPARYFFRKKYVRWPASSILKPLKP